MLTYFRILAYGRPYLRYGVLALAALLVSTLFSAVSLVSVIPFLEILFNTEPVPPPTEPLVWYAADSLKAHGFYLLSRGMAELGPQQMLLYFCLFLLVAILIKNVARYLSAFWVAPLEHGIVQAMRDDLFRNLSRLGMAYFTRRKKGDLIGVLIGDV
ncbi:MAG: ABC transporter ATP-binding protein, partial [Bacteroidetes bacterium]